MWWKNPRAWALFYIFNRGGGLDVTRLGVQIRRGVVFVFRRADFPLVRYIIQGFAVRKRGGGCRGERGADETRG